MRTKRKSFIRKNKYKGQQGTQKAKLFKRKLKAKHEKSQVIPNRVS